MLIQFDSKTNTSIYNIVKSLETIAGCMLKSNEMAKETLKKGNELHEANMAMVKESQIKIQPIGVSIQLERLDGT